MSAQPSPSNRRALMRDLLLYPPTWTLMVLTPCIAWLWIGLSIAEREEKDSGAPSEQGSSAPEKPTPNKRR